MYELIESVEIGRMKFGLLSPSRELCSGTIPLVSLFGFDIEYFAHLASAWIELRWNLRSSFEAT